MKFDISQQPLVPAFLTLLALAVAAACCLDLPTGTLDAAFATAIGETGEAGTDGLMLRPLNDMLGAFEVARPVWSRVFMGFLILFTGMCTGRMTVRSNLYGHSTCLAIPLYGIIVCGLNGFDGALAALTASALLALAVKNFCRSFRNGYSFDVLFRAGLYTGILLLVRHEALPLVLLLPSAILLFRRTRRESIVALAGLVIPPLVVCYLNWGAGGTFLAPLLAFVDFFDFGVPFGFLATLDIAPLLLAGAVALLDLLALGFFFANIYLLSSKSRTILLFATCAFILTLATAAMPTATAATFALWAVPSAILLPVFFVRAHRNLARTLYAGLWALAVAALLLQ